MPTLLHVSVHCYVLTAFKVVSYVIAVPFIECSVVQYLQKNYVKGIILFHIFLNM